MSASSATALLSILQRHGLSTDALEDMVRFCERRSTGSLTLHVVEGTISVYEDHGKRPIVPREKMPCLTRM